MMEEGFCPVLCISKVAILQAFRGISYFVWYCKAVSGLPVPSGKTYSTKHGNCSAWRGCDYYLFPAEWCDFAGYSFFDQPDGIAACGDLAVG